MASFVVQQLSPLEVYRVLLSAYGQLNLPVESSPLEVMLTAVIKQGASYQLAVDVLELLQHQKLLSASMLSGTSEVFLFEMLSPLSVDLTKVKLLKAFISFYHRYGGEQGMKRWPATSLRSLMLQIQGIEPETVDYILLFALDKPTVVPCSKSKRVFSRVGKFHFDSDYQEAKVMLSNRLPHDLSLLKSVTSLVQYHSEHYCHTKPKCEECPVGKACLNRCRQNDVALESREKAMS